MTFWSFYFMAKCYLHFRGYLHIHFLSNLMLMGLVILPIPPEMPRGKLVRGLRNITAAALAILLLWNDSWQPSLAYGKAFSISLSDLNAGYALRLLRGWFNPLEATLLVALLAACEYTSRRKFRPMFAAIVMLWLVGVQNLGAGTQAVGQHVNEIYLSEGRRVIRLPKTVAVPDFDIVVLHVGSLSWDDLDAVDRLNHPLLERFDYLFTEFNTATSYSAPAALRLFRAACGQSTQEDLYKPWPPGCNLVDELRAKGYKTYTVFNYQANADGRSEPLVKFAHADKPAGIDGLPVQLVNYDDAQIVGNFAALQRWWQERQASQAPRAWVYYDTITLHGGAHEPKAGWWKESRISQYRRFLDTLAKDLDDFYALLKSSGRNVVVIFVPEYGLGLRNSPLQSSELSELPLPQITRVPMGIKLISRERAPESFHPKIVSNPVSYLAIADIIASFLRQPPFGRTPVSPDAAIATAPTSPFLTENEKSRAVRIGDDFYLFTQERKWIKLQRNMTRLVEVNQRLPSS